MNLRDFIPHALDEILAGIKNAKQKLGDDVVITDFAKADLHELGLTRIEVANQYHWAQAVEFDVAVSVETEKGGKINLNVLGVNLGGEAGTQHTTGEITHIKFQVALALPQDGAKQ